LQPAIRDWINGEVEAIPGKTMPALKIVTRDYKNLYNQFISFGPLVRANGLGAHGTSYNIEDFYDEAIENGPRVTWDGKSYPSLADDVHACNAVLRFATVTNGELAHRSYKRMEEKVGLPLTHLVAKDRNVRVSYAGLQTLGDVGEVLGVHPGLRGGGDARNERQSEEDGESESIHPLHLIAKERGVNEERLAAVFRPGT